MESDMKSAKIYLLVGFFGSGKTTFIRNLLGCQTEIKYAIIQNQFAQGQMGIQQPLIVDESGTPFSSFLELPNGCICCSAKNDLVAAIEYIIENTQVSNIVVETNGIADPAQSIKQFWFDQEMKIKAKIHSVITLISVRKWQEIKQNHTLLKQIVFANKILLTFVDKSSSEQVNSIQEIIKQMNPECQIANNKDYNIIDFISGESIFKKPNEEKFNYINNIPKNKHHSNMSIYLKGICTLKDKIQIEREIGNILWQSGLKILRIKGIFSLPQQSTVFQLQGVEDLFEIKQTNTLKSVYKDETRILVIGQKLQTSYFYQNLKITAN